MKPVTNKYGLRVKNSGNLLGFRTEDCTQNIQYVLDDLCDNLWLVDDPKNAAWVRHNSTEWYNSGYDTPTHDYEADDLEVVEINLAYTAVPAEKCQMPTVHEFFEARYAKKDPKHWEYLQRLMKEETRHPLNYSWNDYKYATLYDGVVFPESDQ